MNTKRTATIERLVSLFLLFQLNSYAQTGTIYSGVPWYTENRELVSAHGAGILKKADTYYLFGEFKSDTTNNFCGVSCYSSKNLSDWKFENIVLPVQPSGQLGNQRVGERPKVLQCPGTGEYIMLIHTDNSNYKDPCVAYATSKTITGIYQFQGPLLYHGKPIRKWDIGTFQDSDGKAYLITHGGNLFELSNDYKSISRQVVSNMTGKCESPVIFKKDSIYYWIGSGLTGWERNDNYYYTASHLKGPWIPQGLIAPKGTLSWNSQSTWVLPVYGSKDTSFIFMGDRWSQPHQHSAATYVWQPLQIKGTKLALPYYLQTWEINTQTGEWEKRQINGKIIDDSDQQIIYKGKWNHQAKDGSQTNSMDSFCSLTFTGTGISLLGHAAPDGGYARIELTDRKGNPVITSIIDFYCNYPESSLKFHSPKLPRDEYTLKITALGKHWFWITKSGKKWESKNDFIYLNKLMIDN